MSSRRNSSLTLKCTRYCSEVKSFVVTAPVTDENNNGIKDADDRSSNRTSKAKITAATGVVKIDAIAPAAPQPINNVFSLYPRRNTWPMVDPREAPVEIIGDSNPTDPPNPAVNEPPINELNILWRLILPSSLEMTYRIRGTPCSTLSRIKYFKKRMVSKMPTSGVTKKSKMLSVGLLRLTNHSSMKMTDVRSKAAAIPEAKPMITLRIRTKF